MSSPVLSAPLPQEMLLTPQQRRLVLRVREVASEVFSRAAALDAQPDLERRRHAARDLYRLLFQRQFHIRPRSFRERVLMLQELARADAGVALSLPPTQEAISVLASVGVERLRRDFVEPARRDRSGAWLFAGALSEPAVGSDAANFAHPGRLGAVLIKRGAGFILSGTKWLMTNGGVAAAYLVAAQFGPVRGVALVRGDAPGVTTELLEKRGLRSSFNATLTLARVQVPAHQVFLNPQPSKHRAAVRAGQRAGLADRALETAAICSGVATTIVASARAHAVRRRQGGRRILEHQAVALRLAEIEERVVAARALVWHAACLRDVRGADLAMAAAARGVALDAARHAAQRALELVAGPAVLTGHPLEKLARDVEALAIAPATPDLLRLLSQESV